MISSRSSSNTIILAPILTADKNNDDPRNQSSSDLKHCSDGHRHRWHSGSRSGGGARVQNLDNPRAIGWSSMNAWRRTHDELTTSIALKSPWKGKFSDLPDLRDSITGEATQSDSNIRLSLEYGTIAPSKCIIDGCIRKDKVCHHPFLA